MGFDLNTREFLAGVAAATEVFEHEAERVIDRSGERTGERAAELAPMESGELRASKYVVEGHDDDGYFVEVGFTAGHASEQEFGTSTTPAKPFLRPALSEAAARGAR